MQEGVTEVRLPGWPRAHSAGTGAGAREQKRSEPPTALRGDVFSGFSGTQRAQRFGSVEPLMALRGADDAEGALSGLSEVQRVQQFGGR